LFRHPHSLLRVSPLEFLDKSSFQPDRNFLPPPPKLFSALYPPLPISMRRVLWHLVSPRGPGLKVFLQIHTFLGLFPPPFELVPTWGGQSPYFPFGPSPPPRGFPPLSDLHPVRHGNKVPCFAVSPNVFHCIVDNVDIPPPCPFSVPLWTSCSQRPP